MIINYSNLIIENAIKNMKSQYVSVMFDGATKWKRKFLLIILYTRFECVF